MRLRSRALVALGLALSFVVSAAAPAYAIQHTGLSASVYAGFGNGWNGMYSDNGVGTRAYLDAFVDKYDDGVYEHTCTEVWIDQVGIGDHRAPDVFVNCREQLDRFYPILPVTMPYGGGVYYPYTGYDVLWGVNTGTWDTNASPSMMICRVAISGPDRFRRNNPGEGISNCVGSGLSVNPFNGRNGWIGELSFGNTLQYMNNWDEPQHIRADGVASLYEGQTMVPGDLLVSIDGKYSARMRNDGNFVVIDNAADSVVWAASWCGLSPVAGSIIKMQTDGNLVIFGPASNPGAKWASVNINTCGGGTFGGSANRLEMQTDGNLVVYSTGGVRWDRF